MVLVGPIWGGARSGFRPRGDRRAPIGAWGCPPAHGCSVHPTFDLICESQGQGCCHNVYYIPTPEGGCRQQVRCGSCDEVPFDDVDLSPLPRSRPRR